MPYATMLERTRYFEIDSAMAGARYGIWVTVPTSYARQSEQLFPAIYAPDGNDMALLVHGIADAGLYDPINPVQSSIQISVVYWRGHKALSCGSRPRPAPAQGGIAGGYDRGDEGCGLCGHARSRRRSALPAQSAKSGRRSFPRFPERGAASFIARQYRTQPGTIGLFGHSYGGLFTAYAALQKSTIFKNFGASSPGILVGKSVIFKLFADALASGGLSQRNLHMMAGTREITAPTVYQWLVGEGTVEFIKKAGMTPIKGLNFSSHLIDEESHVSLVVPAMFSFLRAHYAATA